MMKSRLHSVFIVLLACLMLGASSQSAVCELACSLGGRSQCHGADSLSANSSSGETAGMPQMRCSGMKSRHASMADSTCVRVEGREGGLCKHPSPLATASSVSRGEAVQAVHWVVIEPIPTQTTIASSRVAANSKAPPLNLAFNSLLIALRV